VTGRVLGSAEFWDITGAPRFLLRDRDGIYGADFRRTVQAMDIDEVLTAPRSPWQNPFVERVIGSIRRECPTSLGIARRRAPTTTSESSSEVLKRALIECSCPPREDRVARQEPLGVDA
jgi:hypothetical protein